MGDCLKYKVKKKENNINVCQKIIHKISDISTTMKVYFDRKFSFLLNKVQELLKNFEIEMINLILSTASTTKPCTNNTPTFSKVLQNKPIIIIVPRDFKQISNRTKSEVMRNTDIIKENLEK